MPVTLPVDFPAFKKYALPVAMKGYPVMLRGDHGIGKSQAVYQLVDDIVWDPDEQKVKFREGNESLTPYTVVERRVSQMTEGDLLGIPDPQGFDINGKAASKFRPFSWLVQACTEPVILFLDELDRGIAEVRQGFFELADSRKIAGWELHPGTVIFSAINGGGDNAARYQVNELGLAEADRWATFDLKPTVEDWLNWGKVKDNLNPLILEFILKHKNHLEVEGNVEPGKKYPSRRSWKRLNDCLVENGYMEEDNIDARAIRFVGDSFVGYEAANQFSDFVTNYEFQLSPDDILKKGLIHKTENWSLNQHLALADRFIRDDVLKKKLTKKGMENFGRWFLTLPAEVGMTLFNAMADGPPENTKRLHRMEIDGVDMNDHLCVLLTGGDTEHKSE